MCAAVSMVTMHNHYQSHLHTCPLGLAVTSSLYIGGRRCKQAHAADRHGERGAYDVVAQGRQA
eukprot:scaffold345504_cov15-Prasinocladus_malaysianus.AAC.1